MKLNEEQPTVVKITKKNIKQAITVESKYITDLFATIPFPERCTKEDTASEDDDDDDDEENTLRKKPTLVGQKTSRATSLTELQKRLEAIQLKKKQTFKEKLKKKGLKNQLKRKQKGEERNAQKKLQRAVQLQETEAVKAEADIQITNGNTAPVHKSAKPIFNSEGKMVFSKFDFSGLGTETKKKEKQEKDPKKILENLKKQKDVLTQLEADGEVEKANQIKDNTAWRNAIAKAEGAKIKDDPVLLRKTLKKRDEIKKSSKKKWDKRMETVEHAKDERQKKRQDNIDKRKKEKKTHKLKKAAKKGKIIPGF